MHNLLDHGCLSYPQTWAFQQILLHKRLQQRKHGSSENGDCVVILEQAPVYTLGRGADENHLTFCNNKEYASEIEKLSRKVRGQGTARLSMDKELEARMIQLMAKTKMTNTGSDSLSSLLQVSQHLTESISPVVAPNGVPVYRVDRGGEVTFHGPSQLVVYPMLDLQQDCYKADLHWYLRQIEEVVIKVLKQHYGIQGNRDEINTGVWVDLNKIAAVGISSSRWITTHGFALNVNPDLEYFDTSLILPCGIEGRGVTSMGKVLKEVPTLGEVAGFVTETMQDVFGVELR